MMVSFVVCVCDSRRQKFSEVCKNAATAPLKIDLFGEFLWNSFEPLPAVVYAMFDRYAVYSNGMFYSEPLR